MYRLLAIITREGSWVSCRLLDVKTERVTDMLLLEAQRLAQEYKIKNAVFHPQRGLICTDSNLIKLPVVDERTNICYSNNYVTILSKQEPTKSIYRITDHSGGVWHADEQNLISCAERGEVTNAYTKDGRLVIRRPLRSPRCG